MDRPPTWEEQAHSPLASIRATLADRLLLLAIVSAALSVAQRLLAEDSFDETHQETIAVECLNLVGGS